ncbi:MAG: hypothetical protein HWN66_09450 [Candidatus Helarchaeota archaeon]|nr:hypothetical protein [Candidatus Helarchaeota archaeon]
MELKQVLKKKIKIKLESSVDDTPQLIEPLLQDYKGAELHFQKQNNGAYLEFNIGSDAIKNKASIFIAPDSDETTNMILEVISIDDPTQLRNPDQILKRLDIIIEDILFHLMSVLKIKDKAKIIEQGKICPDCKLINDVDAKFCKECGFNFSEKSPPLPQQPQQPIMSTSLPSAKGIRMPTESKGKNPKPEVDLIKQIDVKYPNQYECELCEMKCAYKDPFILLLSDIKNLGEPFQKFDDFLRTKDLTVFADYIYDYALAQLKQYPNLTNGEIRNIAYCIFSILSFHILEKAPKNIRLTFAEKLKDHINTRFKKEHPSTTSKGIVEGSIDSPYTAFKTGSLHIETNRCPYCYKKFDEKTLRLKTKGYMVRCPACDTLL